MKNYFLNSLAVLMFCTGCKKSADLTAVNDTTITAPAFIKYTIQKGKQFCDQSYYKAVDVSEMKFVARFDSTAVYKTMSLSNQDDINKLYGFADNNSDHHSYSARFGWRWSGNALRLFAYIYNEGTVTSKELAIVKIGAEINCSIQVTNSSYLFTVNGDTQRLPRMASTPKGAGYQLYPYFGGDEPAPHDINIWIKNL